MFLLWSQNGLSSIGVMRTFSDRGRGLSPISVRAIRAYAAGCPSGRGKRPEKTAAHYTVARFCLLFMCAFFSPSCRQSLRAA